MDSEFVKTHHTPGYGRALPAEKLKMILPAGLGVVDPAPPAEQHAQEMERKNVENCNVATEPHRWAKTTDQEKEQALHMLAGGATPTEVAGTFGITTRYVRQAIARRFGSVQKYKEMLVSLALENGVAAQCVAAVKMDELTGPQAVLAGKLLVETALAVESSIQNAPKTIDFGAIRRIGETLEKVKLISQGKLVEQVAQAADQTTQEISQTLGRGEEFDPRGA